MAGKHIDQMSPVELARRLAELGEGEKALQAYELALKQEDTIPTERFEAACAVLQYGEDYRPAYDAFLALCNEDALRADAISILTDAFYVPNEEQMKKQYEKNCRLLQKYPYIFRTDFLPFEELPIKFYPYDDNGVIPFYMDEERFDKYIDFNEPVIRHYFFRDLEKPILAEEIISHYELEYLRDNVRRSDWVGKENHIYLHFADWGVFCSHLQHWDMKTLLEDAKLVFLIGDEISLYPIDFKERFGIDYSQYSTKPFGIREINRLIWHTQLYAHNGGDFFSEILHGHPCLMADFSRSLEELQVSLEQMLNTAKIIRANPQKATWGEYTLQRMDKQVLDSFVALNNRTLKDAMAAYHLAMKSFTENLDPASRIAPVIVLQPHFLNMVSTWDIHESGKIIPSCAALEEVHKSPLFSAFKYVKTFTPLRRPTTSHAATIRFLVEHIAQQNGMDEAADDSDPKKTRLYPDAFLDRILNRSYLRDPNDRLMMDSRIVRFEDGKLNPKATFTALAEFLDIPYTSSMTYCSNASGRDPVEFVGNAAGFDPAPVYRTYETYADEFERRLIEYTFRDLYQAFGYDFQYYDGAPMSQEEVEALLDRCTTNLEYIRRSWMDNREKLAILNQMEGEQLDNMIRQCADQKNEELRSLRRRVIRIMRFGLRFCNKNGDDLSMIEPLRLDPELQEQPLYR